VRCRTESLAIPHRNLGPDFGRLIHACTGNAHLTAPGRVPQLTQAGFSRPVLRGIVSSPPRCPPAPANATRRGAFAFTVALVNEPCPRICLVVTGRPGGEPSGGGNDGATDPHIGDSGPAVSPAPLPGWGLLHIDGHPRHLRSGGCGGPRPRHPFAPAHGPGPRSVGARCYAGALRSYT
jgi:hypothetical protein